MFIGLENEMNALKGKNGCKEKRVKQINPIQVGLFLIYNIILNTLPEVVTECTLD